MGVCEREGGCVGRRREGGKKRGEGGEERGRMRVCVVEGGREGEEEGG